MDSNVGLKKVTKDDLVPKNEENAEKSEVIKDFLSSIFDKYAIEYGKFYKE